MIVSVSGSSRKRIRVPSSRWIESADGFLEPSRGAGPGTSTKPWALPPPMPGRRRQRRYFLRSSDRFRQYSAALISSFRCSSIRAFQYPSPYRFFRPSSGDEDGMWPKPAQDAVVLTFALYGADAQEPE